MQRQADLFPANVLSSVSGTVKGIESKLVANGAMVQSILVENDGEEEAIEGFGTDRDATKLSKEEIRKIVKDAGIVGLGGAGFPTHVKLTPKDENAMITLSSTVQSASRT